MVTTRAENRLTTAFVGAVSAYTPIVEAAVVAGIKNEYFPAAKA
jgi:hypothetical protein